MYDKFCVTDRSMPFWCVANPLSDPFGGPVQGKPDSLEVAKTLAWAKGEGLIEATSFHDDDLVKWDPAHPEDDLDPKSDAYKRLHEIRAVLRKAGVKVNAAPSPRRRSSARSASAPSSARSTTSTGSPATASRATPRATSPRSTTGSPRG